MSLIAAEVLNTLKKLNTIPASIDSAEKFLQDRQEAMIRMAKAKLQVDNSTELPKYLRSANLLAQQAKVYSEGRVYGPITDKELYFILTCRFYHFYLLLVEHRDFKRFPFFFRLHIQYVILTFRLQLQYTEQRNDRSKEKNGYLHG